MGVEEDKQTILEALKAKKGKTKFYMNDFYKFLPDRKPRDVNKLVNSMVSEGLLEYWSSGSTTLIGLKGAGKQHEAEESS